MSKKITYPTQWEVEKTYVGFLTDKIYVVFKRKTAENISETREVAYSKDDFLALVFNGVI